MQGFKWLFCMLLWGLRVTMIPIFCSGLSSLSHEIEERVHRQRWAKAVLLQKISLLQGGVPNGLLQKFLCLGVTCALKTVHWLIWKFWLSNIHTFSSSGFPLTFPALCVQPVTRVLCFCDFSSEKVWDELDSAQACRIQLHFLFTFLFL